MSDRSAPDIWDSHGLWMKAKLCVQRSQAAVLDSPTQGLWAALALELLARAALARIHPVLLADPRDGKNILHAFNVVHPRARSIPARTVFERCTQLIPDFGERESTVAALLADRRNLELHTAVLGMEEMPTRIWLRDYYRATERLVRFLEMDLEDYLGEEAEALSRMLAEEEEEVRAAVAAAIAAAGELAATLRDDERAARVALLDALITSAGPARTVAAACPACGSTGALGGSHVRFQGAEFNESAGTVSVTRILVPESFDCPVCELHLAGHSFLHEAELGGEFSTVKEEDPIKYYDLEVDESDLFEPEYGND
jgi:hypothetical protein